MTPTYVMFILKAQYIKPLTEADIFEKDVKLLNPVKRPANIFFINACLFKELE